MITKELLSGSTSGRPIPVTQTATPGDLIHTADASDTDEVWIYAVNTSGGTRALTIEFGGVTSGDQLTASLETNTGLVLIAPGLVLTAGLTVRAFADAAGVNIVGWVNRIA